MNPADIQPIASEISSQGLPWWSYVIAAFACGLASFIGAYLGQKAKNVATKEDVAEITSMIESVKAPYAQQLEELKGKNQLKMACLDRRLNAHQEAFVLWRKLISHVHQEESIHEVVREAELWWERNCLFLDAGSRQAFRNAFIAAHSHGVYLDGKLSAEEIKANWKKITDAGDFIVSGVDLPPVGKESLNLSEKKL